MIGSLLQADFEEIIASKNWDELREVLTAAGLAPGAEGPA